VVVYRETACASMASSDRQRAIDATFMVASWLRVATLNAARPSTVYRLPGYLNTLSHLRTAQDRSIGTAFMTASGEVAATAILPRLLHPPSRRGCGFDHKPVI
jgi:hypothetical protein